jgi:hypothetical protein
MAPFFHQTGQHQIGIECRIALNGISFPIQPKLLLSEMVYQYAA